MPAEKFKISVGKFLRFLNKIGKFSHTLAVA